jgi:hypothetical protein
MTNGRMYLFQLEEALGKDGFAISRSGIRYLILTQKISKPHQDELGNFVFSRRHLNELRQYLSSPHKRGRKSTRRAGRHTN